NVNKVWKGNSNTGFVIGGDALPEGTYYYVITINGSSEQSGYLLLNK
ncbi:MAG: gliding motility-associated C-terminal domain-containing protein, partial [Cytophagales bacterium]|nr:gliding motility-associated C-terminal domain-containing protein [Cytophagales bacterium]